MQLDELKSAWAELKLRQDGLDTWLRANEQQRRLDTTRGVLRWSLVWRALELLLWIGVTMGVASFWVAERANTHWLVMGLVLHLYCIAAIWCCATQLLLIMRIQLVDAPVLLWQRRVAQLRQFRVISTLALGLPWWCLWLLATFVAVRVVTGDDLFVSAPTWFWSNLVVGVLGMFFSIWLARRVAANRSRSAFWQRMIDDLSGCNLRRAAAQLDALARFERA